MQDIDPPVLNNATLELRKVRFANSDSFLDSFEIPLHPSANTPTTTK
jgi:hypothetical protein